MARGFHDPREELARRLAAQETGLAGTPTRAGFAIALALLAGGMTACASREIPIPKLAAEYSLPASHTFAPSPGLRVHYTNEGKCDGRTLILVHGFAASVHAWRPWIERLKPDYRVVAIDLPGHGLTQTPKGYRATLAGHAALIDALATEIGANNFILAGHSMGGAVSIAYAKAHPEKLDALILVDAAGWPGDSSGPPGFTALFNNPVGRWFIKLFDPRLLATGGLESAYRDKALVTETLVDRYVDLAMAEGHRDVLLTQRMQADPPWTPVDFHSIRIPTLVMSGEDDRIIPVDNARAMAAAIPGAKLALYLGAGHLPMEQLPDETVRDLRSFIATLGPPDTRARPRS